MERISLYQLASMIILFLIGSSPLFLLASEAKQDAWIAVGIAMICGLVLLIFVTLNIQMLEPDKNLIEIIKLYFGKVAGLPLAWAYALYFIYKSVRNVREFGDLMIQYLLPDSPLLVITGILMLISGYAVFKGVEVFFRVAELLLPLLIGIYIIMVILLFATGLVEVEQLMPVLGDGIRPVLSAALPEVVSFPFGEMVLFLMFWKYAVNTSKVRSSTVIAYCMAGCFLVFTNILILSIVGPSLAGAGGIPLMLAASMIQIAKIVERMDPFVAILLFLGVLFKQTAYYFGATLTLSSIFGSSHRRMLFPAGAAIYGGALLFSSFMQQIWFGFQYNIKYHFPIFQIVIPLIVLLVMKMKQNKPISLLGGGRNGDTPEMGDEAPESGA